MNKNTTTTMLTDEEIAQAVGDPLDEVYLEDFRKVLAAYAKKLEARDSAKTELEKDAPELLFALVEAAGYMRSHCTIETLKRKVSLLIRKHSDFAEFHEKALAVFGLKETAYDSLRQAAERSNWIPEQYSANDWLADCRRWLEFGIDADAVKSESVANQPMNAQTPVSALLQFPWVDAQAQKDLLRFCETCADGEGYDVPKERMAAMATLGLVRRVAGRVYEITEFGRHIESLLEGERVLMKTPSFPVALRKMWSGSEVQSWLDEAIKQPVAHVLVVPQEPTETDAAEIGAKGGKTDEAERLRFEAWMRGHCWALGATWNGTYYKGEHETKEWVCPKAMSTRMLWAAWRDRAELARLCVNRARQALDEVLEAKPI